MGCDCESWYCGRCGSEGFGQSNCFECGYGAPHCITHCEDEDCHICLRATIKQRDEEIEKLREYFTDMKNGIERGGWCIHDCLSTANCALKGEA
jgi:hypothetical protein